MSFLFNWSDLQKIDFKSIINDALEQISLPQFPNKLKLQSLHIDEEPPILKILDIKEFNNDKVQILIQLKYDGKLDLNLNSKLEINAIRLMEFDDFTKPHFVMSDKETVIPIDFKLSEFKIDSTMTFIFTKKANKLILIFNEDPILEFDIKTSIDELLDDDLIEELRTDTLRLCVDFVKHDLPLIINKYHLIEGIDKVSDIEIKDYTKVITKLQHSETKTEVFDRFNTLSLNSPSFDDVLERTVIRSIYPENNKFDTIKSQPNQPKRKKRVIKMKKSPKKEQYNSPTISYDSETLLSPSPLHDFIVNSPTLIDSSFDISINSIDELTTHELGPPKFKNILFNSSPQSTLSNAISDNEDDDDDDETFQINDNEEHDPYENILHPLDILPSFEELKNSLIDTTDNYETKKEITTNDIIESVEPFDLPNYKSKSITDSKRRTSSNYINLNEFRSKFTR